MQPSPAPNSGTVLGVNPGRTAPAPARLFAPLRQTIESINQTFKGQLDLERHRGRTPAGVIIRCRPGSSR
ncbi:hypothetical protein GCM10010412_090570 [Nonomuraea recticatena]|uniref:Transposase n=1 Tax=Nonomuraea recticatena TaxID=46178 RepID=A0ABP6FPK2_9ACTN